MSVKKSCLLTTKSDFKGENMRYAHWVKTGTRSHSVIPVYLFAE